MVVVSELKPRESTTSRYLLVVATLILLVGVVVAVIRALLPLLTMAGFVLAGGWFWRRYHRSQQQQQTALDSVFYQLIQTHQGRITVLDLALNTKLSAISAKQFLDTKAREFAARFEVTEQGDMIYVFPTLAALRSQAAESIPELLSLKTPASTMGALSQAELARRLGVSANTLRRKKYEADLPQWSRQRDPAQISWYYEASLQRFFPID
jgi:hypothetical protein